MGEPRRFKKKDAHTRGSVILHMRGSVYARAHSLSTARFAHFPQDESLSLHSCYTEAALLPCVRDINALHKNASANNLQAVRKKYAQEKHGSVSGIPPANM